MNGPHAVAGWLLVAGPVLGLIRRAVALAYHLASHVENTLSGIVSWVASIILLAFYSSWRQVDGNRRGSWFKPDSK